MPEVQRIIEGALTLDRIEETIATKEAVGYRFVRNEVRQHEGRPANLASFEDLGLDPPPKRLEWTMKAPGVFDPAPDWEGEMCVENKVVAVRAFRAR
ncbi:MAG: hypothetical protein AB1807_25425 [Pseudomonadota bacterium]